MNVALINKNPTVSRLITLSLNKLGADYIEIDEAGKLDGNFDYIVIDSEVDSDGVDLKAYAPVIMALVPRGKEKPEFADTALEKPFLPTEFIEEIQKITPQDASAPSEESGFADFEDSDKTADISEFENFELPSIDGELEDGLEKGAEPAAIDEPGETPELEAAQEVENSAISEATAQKEDEKFETIEDGGDFDLSDFKFDDLDTADEKTDEILEEKEEPKVEPTEPKNSDIDELSSLVDEIENMDEAGEEQTAGDENLEDFKLDASDLVADEQANEKDEVIALKDENLAPIDDEFADFKVDINEPVAPTNTPEPADASASSAEGDDVYGLKPLDDEFADFMVDEASQLKEEAQDIQLKDVEGEAAIDDVNGDEVDLGDFAVDESNASEAVDETLAAQDSEPESQDGAAPIKVETEDSSADEINLDDFNIDFDEPVEIAAQESDLEESGPENLSEETSEISAQEPANEGGEYDFAYVDTGVQAQSQAVNDNLDEVLGTEGQTSGNEYDFTYVDAGANEPAQSENLEQEIADNFDDIKFDDAASEEIVADTDDEISDEIETQATSAVGEMSDEISSKAVESKISEPEILPEATQNDDLVEPSNAASIGEIDENSMLAAFGLPTTKPKVASAEHDELKTQLGKKIADQVVSSLDANLIREALKGLNIKITISFEEK